MKRIFLLLFALSLFWPSAGVVSLLPAWSPATQQVQDPKTVTVYVTKTGKKYHRDGCRYLSHSKIPMTLKDAKAKGYTPCSVCRPPE
jgi:cbb3-type cytochrome oxidase cytochrome c subunit